MFRFFSRCFICFQTFSFSKMLHFQTLFKSNMTICFIFGISISFDDKKENALVSLCSWFFLGTELGPNTGFWYTFWSLQLFRCRTVSVHRASRAPTIFLKVDLYTESRLGQVSHLGQARPGQGLAGEARPEAAEALFRPAQPRPC